MSFGGDLMRCAKILHPSSFCLCNNHQYPAFGVYSWVSPEAEMGYRIDTQNPAL